MHINVILGIYPDLKYSARYTSYTVGKRWGTYEGDTEILEQTIIYKTDIRCVYIAVYRPDRVSGRYKQYILNGYY